MVLHLKLSDFPHYQYKLFEKQAGYFFIFLIVSGFTTIGNIVVDWFGQISLRQQLEHKNMQSELQFLKSQINPHFFFNTLNSLYSLTLKKSDLAPEIVIKLSDMMRYMLYECNEKKVKLSNEILYLQNYLDLEKLRQGSSIDIKMDIKGVTEDKYIAPLLLIPFLENAFKHSVHTNQENKKFVFIQLIIDKKDLYFSITNNKSLPAFPLENLSMVGGIGLENVNRRLKLIYPNRHTLNILNLQQEYQVNLTLILDE
jgi:LytS/YehU family sensor histidine kinase